MCWIDKPKLYALIINGIAIPMPPRVISEWISKFSLSSFTKKVVKCSKLVASDCVNNLTNGIGFVSESKELILSIALFSHNELKCT
mgnify:CR=1 FL=1